MKVKELIRELNKINPELDVMFYDNEWDEWVDVEVAIELREKWHLGANGEACSEGYKVSGIGKPICSLTEEDPDIEELNDDTSW